MLRTDEEQRSRSRFAIIFISDGLPDDGGAAGRGGQDGSIVGEVRRMKDRLRFLASANSPSTQSSCPPIQAAWPMHQRRICFREWRTRAAAPFSFASGEGLDFLHIDLSSIKRLLPLPPW